MCDFGSDAAVSLGVQSPVSRLQRCLIGYTCQH